MMIKLIRIIDKNKKAEIINFFYLISLLNLKKIQILTLP